MLTICHVLAMITDPGTLNYSLVSKLADKEKDFCKKCQKFRPLRCHHCSTCKKCVMKMDHHCPWTFNCVGFGNQKIFLLFLLYAFIANLLAFILLLSNFITYDFSEIVLNHRNKNEDNNHQGENIDLKKYFFLLCSWVFAASFCLSVGSLLVGQIQLISKNMTNVEEVIKYERNVKDNMLNYSNKNDEGGLIIEKNMEDWRFTFKTILGMEKKWKWFFPIIDYNIYNGGYVYYTSSQKNFPLSNIET